MDCITREQVAFGQAYVQHVGAGFMEDGFEIRLKRPGIRFEVLATAWSQHHALSLCRAFNSSPNLLHKFPTRDAARAIIGNCVRGGAWKGGAFDLKSLADAIHQKTGLTFTDFQPIQDWVEHWNFILPTAGGYCLLPDMVFCTLDGQLHDVTIADPHRHFMTTSHTRAETEAEYARWKATGSREGKVPDDVSEGALSPSLEKLMRLFDFGRVRKHMVQHQWTWAFEEGPRVPRVAELQKVARRHLRSIEEGRSVQSMSGGFLAERWGYRTTLAFKNGGHTIVEASTLA